MDPPDLDVSVVLPTYNEAQTLPLLVPAIAETLAGAELSYELIIVDDASPDGTAAVGRKLAEQHPVRVIERTDERGLATAVTTGFAASTARVCVVMDADGSHPVGALPDMIRMVLDDRTDIAVGSRHVPGGGSENWPLFSQLKSKFAASLAMGVTTMTDPTTGFMAVRRSLLDGLVLDPVGWKIVLETVVKASPARVSEHPIMFTDRTHGQSKQSVAVLLEYLQHLARLYAHRYPSLWEFALFCAVGLLGVVVDLTTVVALKEGLDLDTRLCAVGGFSVAVTSNYALNRRWTFRHARELPLLPSYATFVGASLLGLSVRITTVHLLMRVPGMELGHGYIFSNLVGIAGATLFNFAGAKFFAFDPERLTFRRDAIEEVAEPPGETAHPRSLWVAAVLALCVSATLFVHERQLRTDDEGINVTMARNIAADGALLVRPSLYPGGTGDWVGRDLPELGNLPTYPALLSVFDALGGLAAMGALSLLGLWLCVYFTARTAALVSPRAGAYTGLLMVCSPAVLEHFALLEFEPMLVACCAAGLYTLVSGVERRSRSRSAIGGALLGLGFLVKLWLIVPYVLAGCGFFIVQAAIAQAAGRGTHLRACAAAATAGFLVVAGAHLAFVAIASPQDLSLWLHHVYLGIFTGAGVTGDKLSALGDRAAHTPVWYYPALLVREHVALLPLILFGLPALLRRSTPRQSWLLAAIVLGIAGLVPLSVPAIKEPLYALPVLPFLYMAAGLCVAAFERADERYARIDAGLLRMVCVLCGVLLLIAFYQHMSRAQLGEVAWTPLLRTAVATGMCAVVGFAWLQGRRHLPAAVAAMALLSLMVATFEAPSRRSDAPARIAAMLGPHLRDANPAEPSYVAQGERLLRGYLGRTGVEKTGHGAMPLNEHIRAFVLTGPQQYHLPTEQQRWLRTHTRQIGVVDGKGELRRHVFVRNP